MFKASMILDENGNLKCENYTPLATGNCSISFPFVFKSGWLVSKV